MYNRSKYYIYIESGVGNLSGKKYVFRLSSISSIAQANIRVCISLEPIVPQDSSELTDCAFSFTNQALHAT